MAHLIPKFIAALILIPFAAQTAHGAITTLTVINPSTTNQSHVPVTVGQVFAVGDVPQKQCGYSYVGGKLSSNTNGR
jgi:hypothetical protein